MLCKEKTGFGNLISGRLERSEMEGQGGMKRALSFCSENHSLEQEWQFLKCRSNAFCENLQHDRIFSIC